MPKLIDADALRERMYHDAFETDSDMQKWDSGCWIRYKMFENALEEAPIVDADYIVKEYCRETHQTLVDDKYWLYDPRGTKNHGHIDDGECTICHHKISAWANDFKMCPYCGAIIEEVEDAETD